LAAWLFCVLPGSADAEGGLRLKRALIKLADCVLPRRVKTALFHLAFNLAGDEFRQFAYQYAMAPNPDLCLREIAGRGFQARSIIDVGAFKGDWSRMVHAIWPQAAIHMVEPNRQNQEALAATSDALGATLHWALLGEEEGKTVSFHVMASGSSVLEEQSPLARSTESHSLRTLDTLFADIARLDLLKIDAQGYELAILQGGEKLLGRTDAVILEVSLIEINKGAPLMQEVLAKMHEYGFVAYDILEFHRRPLDRALNQIDVLFLRPGSPLLASKSHF
jgi:FkbM family methyltransferase